MGKKKMVVLVLFAFLVVYSIVAGDWGKSGEPVDSSPLGPSQQQIDNYMEEQGWVLE